MEIVRIITRASGGDTYIENAAKYVLDDRAVLTKSYGVSKLSADSASMQFKNTARFWNNHEKNPQMHLILSYTNKTAPTAEDAMRLTEEIIQPLTENHLALSCIHNRESEDSSYHSHSLISTTNFNDGTMLYSDNATNKAIAKKMANVTQEPVELYVEYDNGKEWKCPTVFVPDDDE